MWAVISILATVGTAPSLADRTKSFHPASVSSKPQFSLIIPAYNEEALLPRTLAQVWEAMDAQSLSGELIVVDNNSTDATAAVAQKGGARVVFEAHNQIARARNAGAAAALSPFLIFLDADTEMPAELLRRALENLSSGEIAGGGATIRFDRPQGAIGEWCLRCWTWGSITFRLAAGSFVYARRDAFEAVGGFSPKVYAGEEIVFSRAMRRWAAKRGQRFEVIPSPPVTTSARKFEWYPPWKVALTHFLLGLFPPLVRSRRFCQFWYQRP